MGARVARMFGWMKNLNVEIIALDLRSASAHPQLFGETHMKLVKVALLVRLEAKPGKESAVAKLLEGALPLANQENTTPVWFALRLGPSTFGIFDAFSDDAGRKAHLAGPIAAALMANAAELLTKAPQIEQVDLLAVKLPT
jgi:quinol monooxygenase YgiN